MLIFWTIWLGVGTSLLNLEQTLPEGRLQKLHLFKVCFELGIGRVKHVLKPVTYIECIYGNRIHVPPAERLLLYHSFFRHCSNQEHLE